MLIPVKTTFGADPEAFFFHNGEIIGSERIIPQNGLIHSSGKIVKDGVQFELNPIESTSLVKLGFNLSQLFETLKTHLHDYKGVLPYFGGLVEVSQNELDSLSKESRELGCAPSLNVYEDFEIKVNGTTYRKRSAGGHPHFDLSNTSIHNRNATVDQRSQLVPLLDIFLGNTSVLLDRDLGAAERRTNYGRAGEYRLPSYGVEYRTPSNFWLRSYTFMTFVFGMGQIAISTLEQSLNGDSLRGELADLVDIDKVRLAIDTNDWDLALDNFFDIRPFLVKHLPPSGFMLTPTTLDNFVMFAKMVKTKGLDSFFSKDVVTHWVKRDFISLDSFLTSF